MCNCNQQKGKFKPSSKACRGRTVNKKKGCPHLKKYEEVTSKPQYRCDFTDIIPGNMQVCPGEIGSHFVITKDYLWDPNETDINMVTCPEDRLPDGYVCKFRLYDGDNVLYYEGYSTQIDFDPLDWAKADSGCTEIRYLSHGAWVPL